jgi:hypothetical protein
MNTTVDTTKQDLDQQSIDERKQRLTHMKVQQHSDMYSKHGFDMNRLDESRLIQRAQQSCDVESYINIQDCYMNTTMDDVRVKCDFSGIVVKINLMKYFLKPGDDVMIPVGAVVFVGEQKQIQSKSNRPTNVSCTLNSLCVNHANNIRVN